MDPKTKRALTSHKGRGRGSRSQSGPSQQTRPQVNSQPIRPQIPPQPYYPQPPNQNYYPQHQPQSQRQYYNQPRPMNPSNYNISMTSEFDPFNDYRDGPSRREPSLERQLPIYDDEDEEIEYVPETQFPNPNGKSYIIITFFIIRATVPYAAIIISAPSQLKASTRVSF